MEYYTGRGIGRIFEEVLRAREAYVISPWISGKYAVELARAVKEGRAYVITSLDSEFLGQLGYTISHTRLIIGIIIATIGIITSIISPIVGIPIITTGIIITIYRKARQRPDWAGRIRVSPKLGNNGFIHIKLYIADGQAWIGSANMTPSAIHNNIEVLVPIPRELALEIFKYAWARAKPWP